MSIAVAVVKQGRVVIAADTQENFGDRKVFHREGRASKIMRIGRAYVATTGWGLYENILEDYLRRGSTPRLRNRTEVFAFFLRFWKELSRRYSLVNEQAHQDDPSPFADLDSSFLIATPNGIYYVSGNLSVSEFDRYYAVGSGSSYALGALRVLYDEDLDPAEIARRACEAAMHYDLYCGGELELYEVTARGAKRARRRRTAVKRG